MTLVRTCIILMLATAISLQAAPILNGGFEAGWGSAATFSDYIRCYSNDTCGWTPSSGGIQDWDIIGQVDYISTHWVNQEGSRSVDLNGGASPGGISQTFDTVPGALYEVFFYLAGNPDGNTVPGVPKVKTLTVAAEGQSANFDFDTTNTTRQNMGWVLRSWTFTAQDSSATLVFSAPDYGGYGPTLDNVRIELVPIPEPGPFLLLGTGILALAGLGRALRRR